MKSTGERLIPGDSGEVELEHMNRYYFVREALELNGKTIVDLASGEGYGSNLLANSAAFVYGIDISEEAVEHARNKYVRNNLQYQQGDASKIPLPDSVADVFVSFETIEHHDKHIEMIKEIKRVLKPDGILIMSSPDKYFYSDLVNYKNPFHIKELYYDEFKTLITSNFKTTYFFSQRTFSGSVILFDGENIPFKKPRVVNSEGLSIGFNPLYNLCLATDNISLNLEAPILFYQEHGKMLTTAEINEAQDKIRKTHAYKIGRLMTIPFRIIQKFLHI